MEQKRLKRLQDISEMYVEFQDGSVYKFPLHIIAEHRARILSRNRKLFRKEHDFELFYTQTMEKESVARQWATYFMRWEEIEKFAVLEKDGKHSKEIEWARLDNKKIKKQYA